eukprot:gb/GEZN01017594.1/.p1 GENE.gb/GEZN01017594.1/~~gb/GEZN01017594.1/.p1  ORF type:complete len:114 (+),score=8.92 gb/GEZN01017594.1/:377-718(+)
MDNLVVLQLVGFHCTNETNGDHSAKESVENQCPEPKPVKRASVESVENQCPGPSKCASLYFCFLSPWTTRGSNPAARATLAMSDTISIAMLKYVLRSLMKCFCGVRSKTKKWE